MNIEEQTLDALIKKTLILEEAIQEILDVLSPELLHPEIATDLSRRLKELNAIIPKPQSLP